jgi:hypothetical protein
VIVPPAGRIIAGQRHIRPIFGECYGDPYTTSVGTTIDGAVSIAARSRGRTKALRPTA